MNLMILDLGCGTAKEEGAIGVDRICLPDVDVIADLDEYPYPFADNTFDVIYLNDVIEHLPDTMATMEDVHRISRPNARIFIRVVNWNSHYTAMDPTHVKSFTENTFDFFGQREVRSYYTHARFDVVNVDLQYNALAEKRFRSKRLMKFLSFYLCNVLEGLNFELRAIKENTTTGGCLESDPSSLFNILRCPQCAAGGSREQGADPGRLDLFQGCWLVCQEESCGLKYPTYHGVAIMLRQERERWHGVPLMDLPVPLPEDLVRRFRPTTI
ncbi:methyltransferase domain-containing protein [Candidatus Bipolaricaulota bacterium]